MRIKSITCNKCNWVAFEVSRDKALKEVETFNTYYDTLSEENQEQYYGSRKSNIKIYERCMLCNGSYKNFRDAKPEDCPDGCTLNPVINRDE